MLLDENEEYKQFDYNLIDKNIANVKNLLPTGGYQLKNNESIFNMCSIEKQLEQVVQNLSNLFIIEKINGLVNK